LKGKQTIRLRSGIWSLFNIGYLCGLRVSEIGKLHQEHFNEPGGELFCTRLKNSISNTIRLDDKRKTLLKKYIREYQVKNGSPLFVSRKGNPLSARQLDRFLKHYAGKAKLPEDKAHWHTLKHSIAVHLAESGADVKELQKYLGHKKLIARWFIFSSPQSSRMFFIIRLQEALRLFEGPMKTPRKNVNRAQEQLKRKSQLIAKKLKLAHSIGRSCLQPLFVENFYILMFSPVFKIPRLF